MPNQDEYKSPIGLKNIYIAEVLQDDASAYLADTPEYLAPAADLSAEPKINTKTQYADDAAFEALTAEAESTLKLTLTAIPAEMLGKLTGKYFDTASGRVFDDNGTPPYFAVLFQSEKSNGSNRYYSYLKGRFDAPNEAFSTKTDTPDPKQIEITFTAIMATHPFTYDGKTRHVKRVFGDEDTTNFDATSWFNQVQTPTSGSVAALALSSSMPADDATGVSVSANQTLTFNNALVDTAINNVMLLDSLNAPVGAAKTLSTDKKTITINPTSNLDASSDFHIVLAGIRDIYGQTLADSVVTFTTAS